jgi:transcriptional regulator with XRE-family HTH domain
MPPRIPRVYDKYPHAKLFGERLRSTRRQRGWSQEFLGAQAGLDRSYVSSVERGEHNPSLETVVRLAHALGESAANMLQGV